MKIDACYQLGYVQDTHGLNGVVALKLDVDNPQDYHQMESVFLGLPETGNLIPFFVEKLNPQGNRLLVKFEEVNHIDEAQELVGQSLFLPLELLPALEAGSFYYHDLLGAQVVDQKLGVLGKIVCWYDQTPQLVLGMEYQQKEILIPYNDEVVQDYNVDKNQLMVTLPDGLLDIYLSEES